MFLYEALRLCLVLRTGRYPLIEFVCFNSSNLFALGQTRTDTPEALDPKSSASTNSATRACKLLIFFDRGHRPAIISPPTSQCQARIRCRQRQNPWSQALALLAVQAMHGPGDKAEYRHILNAEGGGWAPPTAHIFLLVNVTHLLIPAYTPQTERNL